MSASNPALDLSALDLNVPTPDFCNHPNRQRVMQPTGWVKVTCRDCPAETVFDPGVYNDVEMMPWVRSPEEA